MGTNRREWIKQSTLAAIGLSVSFRSLGNEEGILRNFGIEKGLINLGSNENPYGISPASKQAIADMISAANRYQFNVPSLQNFKSRLAEYYSVDADRLLVTAGSGEGLILLARHFNKGNIVTAIPTFGILSNTAKKIGTEVIEVPLTREKVHDLPSMQSAVNKNTQLVYIVNPANPSATMIKPAELENFCMEISRNAAVLVDEAYIDYLDAPDNKSMIGLIDKCPNLLVIRTFSKIHGMAGLRIGFIAGHPTLIRNLEQTYFGNTQSCLSNLSMAAALASLADETHRQTSKQKNAAARLYTYNELKKLDYIVYPSYTNFAFFQPGKYSGNLSSAMLKKNIIVRTNDYPDGKWCRVSIGTLEEMQYFISSVKSIVEQS